MKYTLIPYFSEPFLDDIVPNISSKKSWVNVGWKKGAFQFWEGTTIILQCYFLYSWVVGHKSEWLQWVCVNFTICYKAKPKFFGRIISHNWFLRDIQHLCWNKNLFKRHVFVSECFYKIVIRYVDTKYILYSLIELCSYYKDLVIHNRKLNPLWILTTWSHFKMQNIYSKLFPIATTRNSWGFGWSGKIAPIIEIRKTGSWLILARIIHTW